MVSMYKLVKLEICDVLNIEHVCLEAWELFKVPFDEVEMNNKSKVRSRLM